MSGFATQPLLSAILLNGIANTDINVGDNVDSTRSEEGVRMFVCAHNDKEPYSGAF